MRGIPTDPEDSEILLSGTGAPEGFEELGALLAAARARPAPPGDPLEGLVVAALTGSRGVVARGHHSGRRRSFLVRAVTLKALAAAIFVTFGGVAVAAAAGVLPTQVQSTLSRDLRRVGVSIPGAVHTTGPSRPVAPAHAGRAGVSAVTPGVAVTGVPERAGARDRVAPSIGCRPGRAAGEEGISLASPVVRAQTSAPGQDSILGRQCVAVPPSLRARAGLLVPKDGGHRQLHGARPGRPHESARSRASRRFEGSRHPVGSGGRGGRHRSVRRGAPPIAVHPTGPAGKKPKAGRTGSGHSPGPPATGASVGATSCSLRSCSVAPRSSIERSQRSAPRQRAPRG